MKYKTILAAMVALGVTNFASALEYDFENHPDGIAYYAKVVQVPMMNEDGTTQMDAEGNVVTQNDLAFSRGAMARTASALNKIIGAYGGAFDFENHPTGISQYASVVMVGVFDENNNPVMDAEGNQAMAPELKFAKGSQAWPASNLHHILSAYGLTFDSDNFEAVGAYAKVHAIPKLDENGVAVVDGEGNPVTVAELSFAGGARLLNASKLHAILSAYK